MMIENLIFDGPVQTLSPENLTIPKPHCQRRKCLLLRIMKLFEEIFRMQYELFKTKFNLVSLFVCSNDHRIIFHHSLPLKVLLRGYVDLRHSNDRIRHR